MLKNAAPWIIIAVLVAVGAYYFGINSNKEEIARIETQRLEMKSQRDSLKAFVALKDTMQNILQDRIVELKSDAENLREQVKTLEVLRQQEQLNVRMIRTPDDLKDKFASTFPELPEEKIKLFEEYVPRADLSLQYFGVPLGFSETFIIDHNNAQRYKEQNQILDSLDILNQENTSLNKKLYLLEKEKTEAFEIAYDSAYTRYMSVSELYIDELRKPRFELPHWGVIIGGAAAGILIGTQLK